MPQYTHVEVDMADWLEKERQRHLLQILEHIKASHALARAPPPPPYNSAPISLLSTCVDLYRRHHR